MTDDELVQLIDQGHETPGVEFKSGGSLADPYFQAKLVRAMLGMANRRDGGIIVVGVKETPDKRLSVTGVETSDATTWNHDRLAGIASGYAEPSVQFTLEVHKHGALTLIAVIVREFGDIPVLCRKGYSQQPTGKTDPPREVLRPGAVYVRSLRKPETSEIATQEDMRALIALATDKGVLQWVARMRAAGLLAAPAAAEGPKKPATYDKEIEGLL